MGGPSGNGGNPGNKNRFNRETGREDVDRKNPGGYNFGGEGENAGSNPKPSTTPKAKSVEQPKVKSQMSNTDVKSKLTAKAPVAEEQTADEIILKNKKKGRRPTVLTSVTGVSGYPTLSKKTLLGG